MRYRKVKYPWFLAEVYTLAVDDDSQRWERLTDGLIPVTVNCVQETPKHIYHIVATSFPTGRVLDLQISRPGTKLLKSGDCFVQWRDTVQGGVWGLNFVSDADAQCFVKTCTPSERFPLLQSSSAVSLNIDPPSGTEDPPSPEDSAAYVTDIDQLIAQDNDISDDDVFSGMAEGKTFHGRSLSFDNKGMDGESAGSSRLDQRLPSEGYNQEWNAAIHGAHANSSNSVYENVTENEKPKAPPRRRKSNPNIDSGSRSDEEILDSDDVKKILRVAAEDGSSQVTGTENANDMFNGLPPPPPNVLEPPAQPHVPVINKTVHVSPIVDKPGNVNAGRSQSFRHSHSGISLPQIPKELPDNYSPKKRSSLPRHQKSFSYYDNSDLTVTSRSDSVLKEYEAHLRRLNQEYTDSGFDGICLDNETVDSNKSSTHSASSGRGTMLPTSTKPKTGSDSGSSTGKHSSGTNRGSSAADGDSVDTGELQSFMLKEEEADDGTSEASEESLSSHKSNISYSKQRGAIRKAGWLHVKNMLVAKKRKVERAAKRKWKKYWVCLKGTTLLFFACDDKTTVDETSQPRHRLVVESSISQALPEHPKRDNIFCLSTSLGDAYLFQANSQTEMENWMTAIHSACSSAFARQHGKDDTLKLLKTEVQKLEQQIDVDGKMKKMAELQLRIVSDPRSKQAIVNQITQWEQNLERLHIELYRLRCYMASLQGTEIPNPKTLLSMVSKPTKNTLGRLGYFSVSSLHALVSARTPRQSHAAVSANSKTKKKKLLGKFEGGINTLRGNTKRMVRPPIRIPDCEEDDFTKGSLNSSNNSTDLSFDDVEPMVVAEGTAVWENLGEGMLTKVTLPDNQSTVVKIRPGMLVQDVLYNCCMKRQMDYQNYYIALRKSTTAGLKQYVPDRYVFMDKQEYDEIEVLAKSIHQVELYKYTDDPMMTFGFSIEAELGDDSEEEDQLCVFISEIQPAGLAYHQDLQVGDELLVINGKVVCDLDMLYIEQLIQQETALTLTVRSCRKVYIQSEIAKETDQYIDQLTLPPPPTQFRISDNLIDDLIVPAPSEFDECQSPERLRTPRRVKEEVIPDIPSDQKFPELTNEQIDALLQNAEQVTEFCRKLQIKVETTEIDGFKEIEEKLEMSTKHVSQAQKLRKVILELINTERSYVKDLNCLMLRYLEPLQNETFLTADELDALFGNIKDIVTFQEMFLHSLEEAIELERNFYDLELASDFRRVLFSIGGSFLFYVDHFKLYSTFCASHSRAQKILHPSKGNKGLQQFLEARNPKHQHASSLSSYLIKPIQRVLKYPLLLRELKTHTDTDSDEHYHISEALKGMEKVAEHINDMMKIHEEFGEIFDSLIQDQYYLKREYGGDKVPDLAMDDMVMYGTATWLNSMEDLGKVKKGMEPQITVFVFRLAVVVLCKEKVKRKGKGSMQSVRGSSSSSSSSPSIIRDEVVRYKRLIPVPALQVRNSPTNDAEFRCLWDVVHSKSTTEGRPEKVFQLSCNTSEDKNAFLKALRQIIRDYNRYRNSTPTTSPSVKQPVGKPKTYTPYGGKRFEGLTKPTRRLRRRPFGTPPVERKSSPESDTKSENENTDEKDKAVHADDPPVNHSNSDVNHDPQHQSQAKPGRDTHEYVNERTNNNNTKPFSGGFTNSVTTNSGLQSFKSPNSRGFSEHNHVTESYDNVRESVTMVTENNTSFGEHGIGADYDSMVFVSEEHVFRGKKKNTTANVRSPIKPQESQNSIVNAILDEEQTDC
ncbi:rho guanine nucleotide exchange factor TIAM1-like isoform X3 [Ptychodera flava]|uniref:rho guanine nucleotide exchange factor TIAM1-like isoform X3 n=1 Tax=Ptychodera flava TaxID=63121 RepID=UPI003969F37C